MSLTLEQCKEVHGHLLDAWRIAYRDHSDREWVSGLSDEMTAFQDVIGKELGKPEVEDCKECIRNSIFGGPSHRNSSSCKSGKRPHCTCDMCF